MVAASAEVPLVGCKGAPGLGSKSTHRRRAVRIVARQGTRGPKVTYDDWRALCGDLIVQMFWGGLSKEVQEKGIKLDVGELQIHELTFAMLGISTPTQLGADGGTGGEVSVCPFASLEATLTQ